MTVLMYEMRYNESSHLSYPTQRNRLCACLKHGILQMLGIYDARLPLIIVCHSPVASMLEAASADSTKSPVLLVHASYNSRCRDFF